MRVNIGNRLENAWLTQFTALNAGAHNMVAKAKTYGKKARHDLVASFNQLTLSPKKDGMNIYRSLITLRANDP